uniref:Uncharacterized protein n=1 Tax=Strigamia maritima TaxID=126957 RepID=T1JMQ9_STRMM
MSNSHCCVPKCGNYFPKTPKETTWHSIPINEVRKNIAIDISVEFTEKGRIDRANRRGNRALNKRLCEQQIELD